MENEVAGNNKKGDKDNRIKHHKNVINAFTLEFGQGKYTTQYIPLPQFSMVLIEIMICNY